MDGKEAARLKFKDAESRAQTLAVVRTTSVGVGLCLSIEKDGDLEVFLSPADCKKLIESLQEGVGLLDK